KVAGADSERRPNLSHYVTQLASDVATESLEFRRKLGQIVVLHLAKEVKPDSSEGVCSRNAPARPDRRNQFTGRRSGKSAIRGPDARAGNGNVKGTNRGVSQPAAQRARAENLIPRVFMQSSTESELRRIPDDASTKSIAIASEQFIDSPGAARCVVEAGIDSEP